MVKSAATSRLGIWVQQGFDTYAAHFFGFLTLSGIACGLSLLTLGILAAPLSAGLILAALSIVDGVDSCPRRERLFQGFEFFKESFILLLLQLALGFAGGFTFSFVPYLGQFLITIYAAFLETALMFALFFVVAKRMSAFSAMRASLRLVLGDFWGFVCLYVVASALGNLGAVVFGIGGIVTLPLQLCILAVAFRGLTSEAPSRVEVDAGAENEVVAAIVEPEATP